MTGWLARLLSEPASTTVYECRHCGCTVDPEADWCPDCEHRQVVAYDTT